MDAKVCEVNHLDAELLLPPRKRHLAGFKRQNSDIAAAAAVSNQHPPLPPPVVVASSSSSSSSSNASHLSSSHVSPISPSSIEFQTRLNDLLSSHFSDSQHLSPKQIVEASKSAADAAVKAAEAARAAAQEKALLAAKAVAAAKDALALVASFPPEGGAAATAAGGSSRESNLKKNKLKKHVQVQLLYKKHQPAEDSQDDEELARKLHRDINSLPRISKNSSVPDPVSSKGHKTKKLKIWPSPEMGMEDSVGFEGIRSSTSKLGNGYGVMGVSDSETNHFERMENGEAETRRRKARGSGDAAAAGSASKRRGLLKLKNLPLRTSNLKNEANPKDDHVLPRASPLTEKNIGNTHTSHLKPLFPVEPSSAADDLRPMEAATIWKMPGPACVLAE